MKSSHSLDEVLAFAVAEERAAAGLYTSLAAQTPSDEMRCVLQEFIDHEQLHEAALKQIRADLGLPSSPLPGVIHSLERIGLRQTPATGAPSVPSLNLADYKVSQPPGRNMTYRDLLRLAAQKEGAASRLYSALADALPETGLQSVFLQMAQDEARHQLRFETEADSL